MKQLSEPWSGFLSDVAQQITEPAELHCIGGFVVTAFYGLARQTVRPVIANPDRHDLTLRLWIEMIEETR
jgi:hypothetical protein